MKDRHRIAIAAAAAIVIAVAMAACAGQPRRRRVAERARSRLSRQRPRRRSPEPPKPAEGRAATAKAAEAPARKTRAADTGGKGRGVEFALGGAAPTPAPRAAAARPAVHAARRPASGLKAGFADDNRQFNYFVQFLDEYGRRGPAPPHPHRRAHRHQGRSTPTAGACRTRRCASAAASAVLAQGLTYADGTFLFFPLEHDASLDRPYSRRGDRRRAQQRRRHRPARASARSTVSLRAAAAGLPAGAAGHPLRPRHDGEHGRGDRAAEDHDRDDQPQPRRASRRSPGCASAWCCTRTGATSTSRASSPSPRTSQQFQAALARSSADGGGDTPEDLQAALGRAIRGVQWNRDGIRLAFVITDAPPHLRVRPDYTYVDAVHDARRRGIKFFSVGTGGLPLEGELLLRQIAQYTYGKYIFLTYGERGESEGGAPGSVSHHTGANFQTDKLETIIIRFAKEELAHLTDQPLDEGEDYFQATSDRRRGEGRHPGQALRDGPRPARRLLQRPHPGGHAGRPRCRIVPAPATGLRLRRGVLQRASLIQALSRNRTFTMVERKDLQKILAELELQLSGLADEANAARVGRILGRRGAALGHALPQGRQLRALPQARARRDRRGARRDQGQGRREAGALELRFDAERRVLEVVARGMGG